ncbi:hypothetical protein SUGI_0709990 [Cryptomeria japonica]|nr:hypothetical protein SUGI_0709990 [Cryptomeria japonica]
MDSNFAVRCDVFRFAKPILFRCLWSAQSPMCRSYKELPSYKLPRCLGGSNALQGRQGVFPQDRIPAYPRSCICRQEREKSKSHHWECAFDEPFRMPRWKQRRVISTRDYNSRIEIDVKSMTVTVDAGVEMRILLDATRSEGACVSSHDRLGWVVHGRSD